MMSLWAHVTPAEYPAGMAMFLGGLAVGLGLSAGYGLYVKYFKS